MKRAKFDDLKKQMDFFAEVKKKLGFGDVTLAKRLGIKSRCTLDNYIFAKRAPPIEIIKKLEKISGLRAISYQEVEGKVYRKKREFMPLPFEIADETLKKLFKENFNFLIDLIKSNLTIEDILNKMRSKGYHFDTSKISRCVGSYRINLLSKIKEDVPILKEDVIVPGFIRKEARTLAIYFSFSPFKRKLETNKIKVGLEISHDQKRIRILPLEFGRNIIRNGNSLKILLTEKSGLKIGRGIDVIFDPTKFGWHILDSLYDHDAKILADEAMKRDFVLDNYRSTPANHRGDLSLYKKGKHILIEITQGSDYKIAYHKVCQCFIQRFCFPKSKLFIVSKKKIISKEAARALNNIDASILYVDFNEGWEKTIIDRIDELIK